MTKKRKDNGNAGEDEHSKSLKVAEQLSPSPPRLGFENPLLPLANTYDDDDDDEDEDEEQYHGRREQNGRGGGVGDTRAIVGQYGHGGRHDDDDDEDDDEDEHGQGKRSRLVEVRRDCPYLDTVNRQVLEFDFEKFCSVSLSNLNVYACLVCGKYFQGRGQKSHAYTHSLEAGHHVYINLRTEKVSDMYGIKVWRITHRTIVVSRV